MFRVNDFLVRRGELVCDAQGRLSPEFTRKWNAFVHAIAAIGKPQGRGIRRRELPDGVIVSMDLRPVVADTPAFALTVSAGTEANTTLIRVGFGLVGGLEPQIDGIPITKESPEGFPALKVKPADFDKQKRSRLYFKVVLNKDWSRKEVAIIASPTLPAAEPYTGFKLLGLLLNSGATFLQCATRNLGHATSERRESGTARHWFWAADS